MAVDEQPFKTCRIDMRRFTKENGDPMNCWEVIEHILRPFNCKLRQFKGKYWIVNQYELNSPVWEFSWETLEQLSKSMNTVTHEVTELEGTYAEQQKIRPLKAVNITFYNKDMPEDVTGRNLANWSMAWMKNFFSFAEQADKALRLYSKKQEYNAGQTNSLELNRSFSLVRQPDDVYIVVDFEHKLNSIQTTNPTRLVFIKIEIQKPDGNWYTGDVVETYTNYWKPFKSTNKEAYRVNMDGAYRIKFTWVPDPGTFPNGTPPIPWDNMECEIKNIKITLPTTVTYDRGYYQSLPINGKEYKPLLYVGDARQTTYMGGLLKYNPTGDLWTLATTWNSYEGTEEIKLLDLYARNILDNRVRYKDFLKVNIVDHEGLINANSIIIMNGAYYCFQSFSRDYRANKIDGELIEMITVKQEYQPMLEKTLTTVNGVEPPKTSGS